MGWVEVRVNEWSSGTVSLLLFWPLYRAPLPLFHYFSTLWVFYALAAIHNWIISAARLACWYLMIISFIIQRTTVIERQLQHGFNYTWMDMSRNIWIYYGIFVMSTSLVQKESLIYTQSFSEEGLPYWLCATEWRRSRDRSVWFFLPRSVSLETHVWSRPQKEIQYTAPRKAPFTRVKLKSQDIQLFRTVTPAW